MEYEITNLINTDEIERAKLMNALVDQLSQMVAQRSQLRLLDKYDIKDITGWSMSRCIALFSDPNISDKVIHIGKSYQIEEQILREYLQKGPKVEESMYWQSISA